MNIRTFLRYLFFFLLVVLVGSIEKALGLPIFFVLFSLVCIEFFSGYMKILAWAIFSFILASFYTIPFSLALMCLFVLTIVYELPWTLFQRESFKVSLALLLTQTFLAAIIHFHFDIFSVVYHIGAGIIAFLAIRFWFRKRHSMAKLSTAQRLRA